MGVQQTAAPYQEATYRGEVFCLATAAAGVQVGANTVVSANAAAQTPILGIFNPGPTTVTIKDATVIVASGNVGAGGFCWGVIQNAGITATATANAVSMGTLAVGGTKSVCFSNTALTGTTKTCTLARYIGGPTSGQATANVNLTFQDNLEGALQIPPQAFAGIFAVSAGGSNAVVNASICFAENNP